MPDEATIKRWITKWGAFLLIALLGGLAREAKDRRDGVAFNCWDFAARLVIAAFAGLLAILIASDMGLSERWVGALAGVAGYSGVEAIECAKRIIRGRWGV